MGPIKKEPPRPGWVREYGPRCLDHLERFPLYPIRPRGSSIRAGFVFVAHIPIAIYPTGVAPTMPKRKRAPATPPPSDEGDALRMDQFVSTKQAAELLGVEQSHIRLLLGRNRLRGIKPGGRDWLVFRSSLEEYLKSKSKRGKPPSNPPQIDDVE